MRLLVNHALCVSLVSDLRVVVLLLCTKLQLGIHLSDRTRRAEARCLLPSSVSVSTISWAGSDPPKTHQAIYTKVALNVEVVPHFFALEHQRNPAHETATGGAVENPAVGIAWIHQRCVVARVVLETLCGATKEPRYAERGCHLVECQSSAASPSKDNTYACTAIPTQHGGTKAISPLVFGQGCAGGCRCCTGSRRHAWSADCWGCCMMKRCR
jgi:hypothetical protein